MRSIHVSKITEAVENLCIEANLILEPDIREARKAEKLMNRDKAFNTSESDKMDIAADDKLAICQDTEWL